MSADKNPSIAAITIAENLMGARDRMMMVLPECPVGSVPPKSIVAASSAKSTAADETRMNTAPTPGMEAKSDSLSVSPQAAAGTNDKMNLPTDDSRNLDTDDKRNLPTDDNKNLDMVVDRTAGTVVRASRNTDQGSMASRAMVSEAAVNRMRMSRRLEDTARKMRARTTVVVDMVGRLMRAMDMVAAVMGHDTERRCLTAVELTSDHTRTKLMMNGCDDNGTGEGFKRAPSSRKASDEEPPT